jgi:hypothetical protein
MKLNCWLVLGTMFSTALVAQPVMNSAPAGGSSLSPSELVPAVTNAEDSVAPTKPAATQKATAAKKARNKAAAKAPTRKPITVTRSVPLVPGPAVVSASNVNVRAQGRLQGEVIGKVTKGQTVMVIEEVLLKNSAPDEPSAWAKIVLPEGIHVWVHNDFVDPTTKTVKPKRLNLRGGPGENYSVIGRLDRGDAIRELVTKGDWTQIEAPTNAYAFVAAQYLRQEPLPPITLAANTSTIAGSQTNIPEPPTSPSDVQEPPTLAAAPTDIPPVNPTTPPTASSATAPAATSQEPTTPQTAEQDEGPPPRRIVMREGLVRGTASIQAPSHFELISLDNGKVMNYLFTDSPELDLRRYKGLHIVVTGEEGLDARWRHTPVLTIERLEVLE